MEESKQIDKSLIEILKNYHIDYKCVHQSKAEELILDEIMKELEAAFKATSIIPVTGDAVDALAVVRANLRKAYAAIEKIEAENKADTMVTQDE